MDPEFFHRLAQRARELASRTSTDAVRRQLLMWAEEFETRAAELDKAPCGKPS